MTWSEEARACFWRRQRQSTWCQWATIRVHRCGEEEGKREERGRGGEWRHRHLHHCVLSVHSSCPMRDEPSRLLVWVMKSCGVLLILQLTDDFLASISKQVCHGKKNHSVHLSIQRNQVQRKIPMKHSLYVPMGTDQENSETSRTGDWDKAGRTWSRRGCSKP